MNAAPVAYSTVSPDKCVTAYDYWHPTGLNKSKSFVK